MGWKQLLPRAVSQPQPQAQQEVQSAQQIVQQCYCPQGHSVLSQQHQYSGYPGLLLKLKASDREGFLSLSPIIGDTDRAFHGFEQAASELVDICCPTCDQPFPVYNACNCNADLVALFTSRKLEYANCIGICQRLGCLNAEIISGRDLRLLTRLGYF